MKKKIKKCIAAPFYGLAFVISWALVPAINFVCWAVEKFDEFTEQ